MRIAAPPLAPLAFTSLLATMRESDFCVGVVPSSLPPSGLPLEADPRRPPWVMTLDVPPLPPPLPLRPRMDFGRRVRRHADPAGPACSGFTHVRCCGSPRASSPHGLAGQALASHDGRDCVQLPPARGCYHLAPRRTFTSQSSAHARHTFAPDSPEPPEKWVSMSSTALSARLNPGPAASKSHNMKN